MSAPVNTKTLLGETATLDALIAHELTEFNDDELTLLGEKAFSYNNTIRNVYLPAIREIKNAAFKNCQKLVRVVIGTDYQTPVSLAGYTASSIFDYLQTHLCIYVPDNLVSSYKSLSVWEPISDRIYGISEIGGAQEWLETEIEDDAAAIKSYVDAGTAADRYHIGQYKIIDLGTEGQIRFQIVGRRMRELAESTDVAELEWLAMETLATKHRMNPAYDSNTDAEGTGTVGGYDKSEMKTYLDETIFPMFPSVWQNMIKNTKIDSYSRIKPDANTPSSFTPVGVTSFAKLRLPSLYELAGIANENQTLPYNYLKFALIETSSRIKKKYDGSDISSYWLRSVMDASDANTRSFCVINSAGSYYYLSAETDNEILLSFST